MLPYRVNLGSMVLNAAVAGHDQPAGLGNDGDPFGIQSGGGFDRTRWSATPMNLAAGVAGVGHVRPQVGHDFGCAEDIGVKVPGAVPAMRASWKWSP